MMSTSLSCQSGDDADNPVFANTKMRVSEVAVTNPNSSESVMDVSHTHVNSIQTQRGSNTCGYVIVGDNIDKNIRPRFQRENKGTQSLHYFHSYALKNQIDVSKFTDDPQAAIFITRICLANST